MVGVITKSGGRVEIIITAMMDGSPRHTLKQSTPTPSTLHAVAHTLTPYPRNTLGSICYMFRIRRKRGGQMRSDTYREE